jgi:hypothetical protein
LTGKARLVGAFPASRQVTDLTAGFRRDFVCGILIDESGFGVKPAVDGIPGEVAY